MTDKKKQTNKRRRFSQDFSGNSKTDQSFAASCDVNAIVRHYENTGIDPFVDRKKLETFGDVSSTTYAEAMRHKANVDSAFASLPSSVRAQHANNPAVWLDSLDQPEPSLEALEEPPFVADEPPPEDTPPGKKAE